MLVTTAGGAAGGSASDTDSVDVEIYKGDDPEEVLEAIDDGDTPFNDQTITGPGRANHIRQRTKGHAIGIRLSNDSASSTWAVERVSANLKEI